MEYSAKSLKLARDVGSKEDCADAYKELSEVYGKMNEHKNRFENYKMYILYNDSISNEENTKKQTRTEMQYEFDKKEAKNKAEVEKREEIQKAEARKQRIILWSVISGLLLVVLFAGFIFRSLVQIKKKNILITEQKKKIEEKQKEILDSIHYAARIQRCILPTEKYISQNIARLKEKMKND